MSGRPWQRFGGFVGLLWVVLTVATIFEPSEPDADEPISTIAEAISDDRFAHVLLTYLSMLAAVVFIVFVTAFWGMVRRKEPEIGASAAALAGGVVFSTIELARHAAYLSLVEAADKGREPAAIRALLELDNTLFTGSLCGILAFHLGVALSVIPLRSLPSWLGWSSAALALLFAIVLLGIFSDDYEGPFFGVLLPIALLGQLVWVIAASTLMIRSSRDSSGASPDITTRQPA